MPHDAGRCKTPIEGKPPVRSAPDHRARLAASLRTIGKGLTIGATFHGFIMIALMVAHIALAGGKSGAIAFAWSPCTFTIAAVCLAIMVALGRVLSAVAMYVEDAP